MRLVKTTIDSFNSYEGIGLFSGMGRYAALEGRITLAANASRSLFEFWGVLLKKMLWPTPPKRVDELILPLITGQFNDREVLNAMRKEPASIIMLARYWHDQDKQPRKELEAEWQEVLAAGEEAGNAV